MWTQSRIPGFPKRRLAAPRRAVRRHRTVGIVALAVALAPAARAARRPGCCPHCSAAVSGEWSCTPTCTLGFAFKPNIFAPRYIPFYLLHPPPKSGEDSLVSLTSQNLKSPCVLSNVFLSRRAGVVPVELATCCSRSEAARPAARRLPRSRESCGCGPVRPLSTRSRSKSCVC